MLGPLTGPRQPASFPYHMSLSWGDAVFWAAVVCCAIAQVAIVRSVVVSQRRGVAEVAWAVIPALALGAALVLTWRRLHP